tara:strand:+ start:273 stop:458 length:186 start_codon:yes stop_codon:yes gene_type:complete
MEEISSFAIVICSVIIVLFYFYINNANQLPKDVLHEEKKEGEGEAREKKNQLRRRILRRQE